MECKQCGRKMGILPDFRIDSNDMRVAGVYCSRNCISEKRTSLTPFIDPNPKWKTKKDAVPDVPEVPSTPAPVTPVANQDAIDQGFGGFFDTPVDSDDENPLGNLFG